MFDVHSDGERALLRAIVNSHIPAVGDAAVYGLMAPSATIADDDDVRPADDDPRDGCRGGTGRR